MHPHLSTELALKQFDANAAFSAALAEFQKDPRESTILAAARRAAGHGFSWLARPSEPGFVEVRLRHAGGAEISAKGESVTALLAGLLGHPIALKIGVIATAQADEREQEGETLSDWECCFREWHKRRAEPEQEAIEPEKVLDAQAAASAQAAWVKPKEAIPSQPQPVTGAMVAASLAAAVGERLTAVIDALPPSPAQLAAESLTAATGGVVALGPSEYVPDLDEAEQARLAGPLTDKQKKACVDGIKLLTAEQRKSFTIAFRDAFRVPREEKSIAPLIAEVRHMEFCDRWAIEASGKVAA